MSYEDAVLAHQQQRFVTVMQGTQVLMGRLVGQNGRTFTLETAEGTRVSGLVSERLSPARI